MNKPIEHLIIGFGQIGQGVFSVFGENEAHSIDLEAAPEPRHYRFIHICFPYSSKFEREVRRYQKAFSPEITIIHSTVPVGTSEGLNACHSPVRGIHPVLAESLKAFTKFFGGTGSATAAAEFSRRGVISKHTPFAKTTELMKLWDTTLYGLNIMIQKEIYKHCAKLGADFNIVYTASNDSYNAGYKKLGYPQYQKYVLKHVDGPIGGHCVIPNLALLDHSLAKMLQGYNSKLTLAEKRKKMKPTYGIQRRNKQP